MHIYIYDAFLSQNKYQNLLAKIETRITDLGLNGKIIRLGLLKNVIGAVEHELGRGPKTIVAVGNNKTLHQVVNAVLKSPTSIATTPPIGLIPLTKNNNEIAYNLGIPLGEDACDLLSARRIESLDIGIAGINYFISQASISTLNTKVDIDSDYSIEITKPGNINIINFAFNKADLPQNAKSLPNDSKLELFIQTQKSGLLQKQNFLEKSIFPFNKIIIDNKKTPLILDGGIEVTLPVEIKLSDKKIKIIVGKNRQI